MFARRNLRPSAETSLRRIIAPGRTTAPCDDRCLPEGTPVMSLRDHFADLDFCDFVTFALAGIAFAICLYVGVAF